ncbi:MAG: family oxidoreductase [Hydrocarboniphaga sp.]|uniref:SDR family NAD(P)-dependent oxidoreductase n=1 Tax=Hydrocarboniphaga sp. TaxID=2033016 RepID=UPI00261B6BEE|nr:SDR family NAD(P)-dependent oxidoreductase [Hydrocarboniphaga sp.]MDB5969983.1 family oxidoreductase [Hydrocarboniphaga sp.]
MIPSTSPFDLAGKVAAVTGASGGLGRHFAMTLAGAGAVVAVAARRADKLSDVVDQIVAGGGRAIAVSMDVTERGAVSSALDSVMEQLGSLDIVVNNAGLTYSKRPLEYTDEDWTGIVGTNLRGAWIVAQESARRMVRDRRPGSIVNVTSIFANRVAAGASLYSASKAGLRQLTQALALELARYDIRVNSIAPGYFSTDMNSDFLAGEAGQRMRGRIPVQRFGEYADLDGPLLLLASQAGAYMTGSEIVVDGGHLCSSL